MFIYEAKVWFDNIEVRKREVEKDTEKQFTFKKGGRLNKSMIGCCDAVGTGYGYTIEEAINTVKNNINKEIEKHERKIKRLKANLSLPIKEL